MRRALFVRFPKSTANHNVMYESYEIYSGASMALFTPDPG